MNLEKTSKKLAFLLRHSTDPLLVNQFGWANVKDILEMLNVSMVVLDEIVSEDEKGRYSYNFDKTKIRANQGHSIAGVRVELDRAIPPQFLYHGTATRFLDDIKRDGLKSMNRLMVHISDNKETAINIGKRHGKPVVLVFNAWEFVNDGHELFLSANGVWLAYEVPAKYLYELELVEEKV